MKLAFFSNNKITARVTVPTTGTYTSGYNYNKFIEYQLYLVEYILLQEYQVVVKIIKSVDEILFLKWEVLGAVTRGSI